MQWTLHCKTVDTSKQIGFNILIQKRFKIISEGLQIHFAYRMVVRFLEKTRFKPYFTRVNLFRMIFVTLKNFHIFLAFYLDISTVIKRSG
jgi:hypothetical protein